MFEQASACSFLIVSLLVSSHQECHSSSAVTAKAEKRCRKVSYVDRHSGVAPSEVNRHTEKGCRMSETTLKTRPYHAHLFYLWGKKSKKAMFKISSSLSLLPHKSSITPPVCSCLCIMHAGTELVPLPSDRLCSPTSQCVLVFFRGRTRRRARIVLNTAAFHPTNNMAPNEGCQTAVMALNKSSSSCAVKELLNICFALVRILLNK